MKKTYCLLFCFISLAIQAQIKWYDPMEAGFPIIQNQGWTEEIGDTYVRLPQRAEPVVRDAVWSLSRHSSGLSIQFYSNAPQISIRYGVTGAHSMSHMPATGVSGVDLYAIDSDGEWHFCYGNYSFKDTIRYNYNHIGKDRYHNRGYEYRLFLPLYNSVTWMEIGVPESSELTFIPLSPEKPILLYGTSILHGACASRPGMSWVNILHRNLDYPTINLGFSGNGRLEKEVLDFITEVDGRLYVLDCLPNLTGRTEDEVYRLIVDAVHQLRKIRTAPVLLVEHIGYSNAATDSVLLQDYMRMNNASKRAYKALLSEGDNALYYLTREELNIPADGWVDTIHPTDLGAQAQADAVEKKIREILRIPLGNISTTQPVTQRREPNNYEWKKRHWETLTLNKRNPPRAVILGNSITHFWGGQPQGPRQSGPDSWADFMQPEGFHNLGSGWDRIENVLWRVYHDELDGFNAEKVVLMIGTNNFGTDTDDDIVDGLRFLLAAIREKQSDAAIHIMGILPRRNEEERVVNLNYRIQEMVMGKGYIFRNPGKNLLLPDGKINESLFSDGLHPNADGYRQIAAEIAR